jgi:hypothetical protein
VGYAFVMDLALMATWPDAESATGTSEHAAS